MRILGLEADNFKRLRAVAITPTSNVVEVTGENSNGKTSVLDAIWAALGGKDAVPAKPIRTGEQKAEVRVLLGDGDEPKLKVTRRFGLKDGVPYTTDLIVEGPEGARLSSPQGILDALVGQYCFDPMSVADMEDKKLVVLLRRFVPDVDFGQVEGLNKRDFDQRTEVNRRARDLRAQAGALPEPTADLTEVDEEALVAKLGSAAEIDQLRARREAKRQKIVTLTAQITAAQEEVKRLEEELAAEKEPQDVDVSALQDQLNEARRTNQQVARMKARVELETKAQEAEAQSEALTKAIDKRKADAATAVAKAQMPVAGLGFAEQPDGTPFVTLNGEPFAQASMAEKIRTSLAIAAAMNPKLRVARISDGSLLDKRSWAMLEQYAQEHDLQVWVETVQQHGSAAVVIEDGGTVTTNAPAEAVGDVI